MKVIDCYICSEPNQILKPERVRYGGLLNLTSLRGECTLCGSLLYSTKIENSNIRFTRYIIRGTTK